MADIICIIGSKGGSGKTTLAHMLCQGMNLLGQRSVCVHTDPLREPLDPAGRGYLIADARTQSAFDPVVDRIRSLSAWLGVIDGSSNSAGIDRRLYGIADLALLPFRDSPEDLRAVKRDLETFPYAYAIPMQWPTQVRERQRAETTVATMLAPYRERLLAPVASIAASKLLLQERLGARQPKSLDVACRAAARQIADLLQLPLAAAA